MVNSALESIKLIPQQIRQVWSDLEKLDLPSKYQGLDLVAISGMGGSIYNYYVLESVFKKQLKTPLVKINNYGLPGFINEQTLFIASSYSGTTEEVIYNLDQALAVKAQVLVFSEGGPLIEKAKELNLPFYQFNPKYNPSLQPRMGQGYMLFGAIGLLWKLNYLSDAIDLNFLSKIEQRIAEIHDQAKKQAATLFKKELYFVASDHLSGNAHILRNQTNETAKLYANYNLLPELNHHLLEGLKHPENRDRIFVFLNSDLYQLRNQQRLVLTRQVIEKNGYKTISFTTQELTQLGQFVEVLIWGGYLTYELGLLYQEDPNQIPWVDYFKKKLGKI